MKIIIFFRLSIFMLLFSCTVPSVKNNKTFSYRGSSHHLGFGDDDEGVTACSLAGPESHVAIVTLVSSTWENRICGEKLPESRFRYIVSVSTPILDSKLGKLELLGQQSFDWLPETAKAGDQFLVAYRTAGGANFLMQWAEMLEDETNTVDRRITLPPTIDELKAEIQKMRGSDCKTDYIGFKSPFSSFVSWGHTECGGQIEKITEPPINNGVDL